LEEANKIVEGGVKLMDVDSLAFLGANVVSGRRVKPKRVQVKTRVSSLRSRLGRIMHRLYDLEPDNEPEGTTKIELDVDLYQMESV
jgi:hypothetical protein